MGDYVKYITYIKYSKVRKVQLVACEHVVSLTVPGGILLDQPERALVTWSISAT